MFGKIEDSVRTRGWTLLAQLYHVGDLAKDFDDDK